MKRLSILFLGMMALASCSNNVEPQNTISDSEVVENVMMSRRSIRQYTKQTISRDTLDQIIKCGINAPNGQNRQAYELRIVNNPKLLKQISDAVIKDKPDVSLKPGADNIFFGATTVIFVANDTSYDMSQIDCGLLGDSAGLLQVGKATLVASLPTLGESVDNCEDQEFIALESKVIPHFL
jgi:nitroreductase